MIQKLIFKAFPAILLVFQVLTFAQTGDGTNGKYYNYAGKFKVAFPGTPTLSNDNIETDMGTVGLYQFLYETETSAYMVGYSDYPADQMEGRDGSEMLDNAKSGFCESLGLTVTGEGTAWVGSHQGIWFDGTDYEQYYAVIRDFLIDNRLYQVGILSIEPISEELKKSFLSSFEIVD